MIKNSKKVVFVIEKDHDHRVEIRREIEMAGHRVVSAASESEALDLLKTMKTPALILVDENITNHSIDEFILSIRKIIKSEITPISLIYTLEKARPESICCVCRPGRLEHVTKWLNSDSSEESCFTLWTKKYLSV